MTSTSPTCELESFDMSVALDWEALPLMPTVCLLALDSLPPLSQLESLVDGAVNAGCRYFMAWGKAADQVHDELDSLLEDRGGDFLNVVTASHKDEPIRDLAWYLINAALPAEKEIRCCIGYTKDVEGISDLLAEVHAEVPPNLAYQGSPPGSAGEAADV